MPDIVLLAQKIAVWALPVLFAFALHAMATAWLAYRLGDGTPEIHGRLSLNPLNHVDPLGTVIVPLLCLVMGGFVIGWPKAVPIDPTHFSHPRKGLALVSMGSMGANLAMATVWAILLKQAVQSEILSPIIIGLQLMAGAGVMINLAFVALSLLPVPPLAGGQLLKSLMVERHARLLDRFEPHMSLIVVILVIGGILSPFMLSVMEGLQAFIFTVLGVNDYRAF